MECWELLEKHKITINHRSRGKGRHHVGRRLPPAPCSSTNTSFSHTSCRPEPPVSLAKCLVSWNTKDFNAQRGKDKSENDLVSSSVERFYISTFGSLWLKEGFKADCSFLSPWKGSCKDKWQIHGFLESFCKGTILQEIKWQKCFWEQMTKITLGI
jgi:hypothetical protein